MEIVIINNDNRNLVSEFIQHKLSRHFRYFLKRKIDCLHSHLITIIGTVDSKPVAYGHIDIDNEIYWVGVCILEAYQGRGYGTKIIKYLLDAFKRLRPDKMLYLTVDKDNTGACILYQNVGFKVIEETDLYYRMNLNTIS